MADQDNSTIVGEVTDIFAHRFVVRTRKGKMLADLGPKNAERVSLHEGDRVTLSGEMKPSEFKVRTIQKNEGPTIDIDPTKPHHRAPPLTEHSEIDAKLALETVRQSGFAIAAVPRRKPKHFEILGRDGAGDYVELHVELDGALRKTRPVDTEDPKWAVAIRNHS